MDEYKSNSHKSKVEAEEKRVEKVVTGKVTSKKKSHFRKFTDMLITEDADSLKSYILLDVIVPAIRDGLFDAVRAILYGGGKGGHGKPSTKVQYRSYYDSNRRDGGTSIRSRNDYDYNDIALDDRGEAEEVLMRMDELLDTYGVVSVSDFYDLVGVVGNYTDGKYGWTNLRNATVIRGRDGYKIKLPKALPLD